MSFLLLSLLACRPGLVELDAPEAVDPRLQALLDWTDERLEPWQVPGVAIALLVDGEIHAGGVGVREWGKPAPVTADTPFRIASVSKMLTAMVVMREVERGRLDLHVPADTFLQGVPMADGDSLSSVTLHELMTHQAGMPVQGMPSACDTSDDALEAIVAERAPTWSYWSDVGQFYNYSNLDYVLAGLAAQRSSGDEFTALVRREVLRPAGAAGITYDVHAAKLRGHAIGHTMDRDTGEPVLLHDLDERACGAANPSGGAIASVQDLAQIAQLLLDEGAGVLSPESFAAMTAPGWSFSDSSWYAYGLQSFEYRGHRSLMHTGTLGGYNSVLWVLPDEQFGAVVLVNADHGVAEWPVPWDRPVFRFVLRALDQQLGLEDYAYTSTVRPTEDWDRYVGSYATEQEWGPVDVVREGDTLLMNSSDTEDGQFEALLPYSRDSFQLPFTGSDGLTYWRGVRFVAGEDGRTQWVLSSRGIGERVE